MNDTIECRKMILKKLNLKDDEIKFFLRIHKEHPRQLKNSIALHVKDNDVQKAIYSIMSDWW